MPVLACHVTWITHETWLPGDGRGWVEWDERGLKPPDPERERDARHRMVESAVALAEAQRVLVVHTIQDHCRIRGWLLHAVNARSNHVHVVVTADRGPDEVTNQLEAWCSRKLSDAAGLVRRVGKKAGRRHWFTVGGDRKRIDSEEYPENAVTCVTQRH